MITYSIEAGLCWLIFYGTYHLFFRKTTFFKYNRLYLLGTLVLGLLLPLIPNVSGLNLVASAPTVSASLLEPITISAQSFSTTLETIVVTANHPSSFNLWILLLAIWIIGASFSLLRFVFGLTKLTKLYLGGVHKKKLGYSIVETTKPHLPFSFMKVLFWSNYYLEDEFEKNKILEHELVHIQKNHSFDNIFIALLLIPFWWIPLLYAYKKELKTIHEYEADAQVTQSTSVDQYGQLLLQYAKSGFQLPLINSFAFTQLKNRIVMMTQQKSNPRQKLKYLAILPLLLFMTIFLAHTNPGNLVATDQSLEQLQTDPFDADKVRATLKKAIAAIKDDFKNGNKALSQQLYLLKQKYPENKAEITTIFKEEFNAFIAANPNSELQSNDFLHASASDVPDQEILDQDVYKVVEEMPKFPGCSEVEDLEEQKNCAAKKMLEFIYSGITYPQAARDQNIEGIVVVRFIVDKKGDIVSPEIVRSIGGGCEEEVLRLVNAFPQWIPGKQSGKTVNVYYNLPVKFKLESKAKTESPAVEELEVVEKPRISGCEDIENMEERIQCANQKLLMEVYTNIKYPELARKNGIQGTSVLTFLVGTNGKIKDPSFKKYIGGNCEEAIMKVFDHLQANSVWIPAKNEKGEAVEAEMVLPVKFKLQDDMAPAEALAPLAMSEYKLFPNPATDQVQISFFPEEAQNVTLEIHDASGKRMLSEKMGFVDALNNHQVKTADWPAGMYFIKLIGTKEIFMDQLQVIK